ncbi:MAG: hypothetical protein IJX24_02365 [Oscillospiraceae bacterium]|nr:hypothetical protein [Oscillospiraceae bacterium]
MKKVYIISLATAAILLCVAITVLFKNDNSYCFDKTYITEFCCTSYDR